jgi:ATP-dependent DNA helicase PIF1
MSFIELFKQGHNIFLTGSGGVGKSWNVHDLIKQNRDMKLKKFFNIALTATTGIASLNICGKTVHKFSGLGVYNKKDDIKKIINAVNWLDYKSNINRADVIIIDEISMLRSDSFVLLDLIFKEAEYDYETGKPSTLPFGGKQMIFVGDYLQLPPVVLSYENIIGPFAFQTKAWTDAKIQTIYLREVKRQNDVELITALNEIRLGKCSKKTLDLFTARIVKPECEVISLTALNKESEKINVEKLAEIKEPSASFFSIKSWSESYSGKAAQKSMQGHYWSELSALHNVTLKKGAKVLITANGRDEQYVNGQLGHYQGNGYMLDIGLPKYDCFYYMKYDFEPLIEQKRVTRIDQDRFLIHDLEGEADNDPASSYNLLKLFYDYNRSKNLEFTPSFCLHVILDNKQHAFIERDQKEFFHPDQDAHDPIAALTVSQFPIKLGWAISMHKSQGQTLKQVYIDPTNIFDYGQFYVALSRCETLDGLYLKSFPTRNIKAHPDALAFYKKIEDEILFKENMIKQAQAMRQQQQGKTV